MSDYLIKDIPDEKKKQFKTACAYFNLTMKDTFLHVIDLTIIQHLKLTVGLKLKELTTKEEEEKLWERLNTKLKTGPGIKKDV